MSALLTILHNDTSFRDALSDIIGTGAATVIVGGLEVDLDRDEMECSTYVTVNFGKTGDIEMRGLLTFAPSGEVSETIQITAPHSRDIQDIWWTVSNAADIATGLSEFVALIPERWAALSKSALRYSDVTTGTGSFQIEFEIFG